MAQAKDTETLYVEIPPSIKYLVDDDDRTNKEIVIAALETELGVSSEDSVAVIDRQVRRLEDRFEAKKQTAEVHQDELRQLRQKLERARSIRDEKLEAEDAWEDALDAVLDELESDEIIHLFPRNGRLDEIREEFDRTNEEIHYVLKQRAAAQDRDILVGRFHDPGKPGPEKSMAPRTWPEEWTQTVREAWGDKGGENDAE